MQIRNRACVIFILDDRVCETDKMNRLLTPVELAEVSGMLPGLEQWQYSSTACTYPCEHAAISGDIPMLNRLLDMGFDYSAAHNGLAAQKCLYECGLLTDFGPSMIYAVECDNVECLTWLVSIGASANRYVVMAAQMGSSGCLDYMQTIGAKAPVADMKDVSPKYLHSLYVRGMTVVDPLDIWKQLIRARDDSDLVLYFLYRKVSLKDMYRVVDIDMFYVMSGIRCAVTVIPN